MGSNPAWVSRTQHGGCPEHILTDKAIRDLLTGGRREAGLARTPQLLGTCWPREVNRAGAVEVIPGDETNSTIETGVGLQKNQGRDWLRPGEHHPTKTITAVALP